MQSNRNYILRFFIAFLLLIGLTTISSCKWGSWDLFGGDPVNDDSDNSGSSGGGSGNFGNRGDSNFPPAVFSAARNATKLIEPVELFSSFEDGSEINELTGTINRSRIGDDFKVSPDGDQVAYLTNQNNGRFELFVVPVDDDTSTRISPSSDEGDVTEFEWSPDGARIAYLADFTIDGSFELYTNDAEGADNQRVSGALPLGGQVFAFEWSPDSQLLAYAADERNLDEIELFSTSPTARNSDRVSGNFVPNRGDVLGFAWSPGSSRIAYLSNQRINSLNELYTNVPEGGDDTNTDVSAGNNVVDFAWAPDEPTAQLAYATLRQIFTVLQDGSNNTQVNQDLPFGGSIREFAWAPDNSRVAYRADQRLAGVVELFTVRSDGSNNLRVSGTLVTGGEVTDFAWAPYSDFIAYRANQDDAATFELYVTSPDGSSGDTKVSGTPMAGDVEPDFAWSPELDPPEPDIVRVAYRADQRTVDTFELFSSTPDGETNDRVCGRLEDGGIVESFSWAPDSSGIGYIADQESLSVFELFASLPDGGKNTTLSGTIASNGDVLFFEWVP